MNRLMLIVLVVLTAAGAAALAGMALQGPDPRARWGYIAATAAFLLSACQTAPAVAFATRIGRGYWGAPLRRLADVLALTGLVSAPLLVVTMWQLPDWLGRPSIWFDWPGAPQLWDSVAIVGLALSGVALTYLSTRGLSGATREWTIRTNGLTLLGALYCMLLVYVHLVITSDLALSLVPAWHSAVIPPYHVVSGFEAAVALVVVLTALTMRGLPVKPDPFHPAAKLLLALGLLWFYFTWCEFLTYWYGRTPDEQALLSLFMFGPGAGLFLITGLCEFVIPVGLLIWTRSNRALTIFVAALVIVGSYVDQLRLYVGAWSVATPHYEDHLPETLAPLPLPGPLEFVASLGVLAFASLVTWFAVGRYGALASAEIKAVNRLSPERRMVRTRVQVVGRPS